MGEEIIAWVCFLIAKQSNSELFAQSNQTNMRWIMIPDICLYAGTNLVKALHWIFSVCHDTFHTPLDSKTMAFSIKGKPTSCVMFKYVADPV